MAKLNLVYITAKDKEEARKIGQVLVEERLVACVNIVEKINSMYWWEDQIQDDTEAALVAKTKEALVPEVIARVKSVHNYSCPCVISLPIQDGNKDFLDWIEKETQ
ncbi:divalent-cation tolerance protein CutA [Candidatus Omnitrophota bacterium]